MRTRFTQGQLAGIVRDYFDRHASSVNFMVFVAEDEAGGVGVIVDHQFEVPLPSDFEDGDEPPEESHMLAHRGL